MDSVKDSAKQAGQIELGEETVMGTGDESKTQFVQKNGSLQKKMRGTGKVSKKKQKLGAEGNPIEKKPQVGGRQQDQNSIEMMSHQEKYKTIDGETTNTRNKRLQRIRCYWAKKWFNYQLVHP